MEKLLFERKDFQVFVHLVFVVLIALLLFVLFHYRDLSASLSIIASIVAVLSIILSIRERSVEEILSYELYLRNLILSLEGKILYFSKLNGEVNGLNALDIAIKDLGNKRIIGSDDGFKLSINHLNSVIIHICEIVSLYKNYNSLLQNRCLLFFHSYYVEIHKIDVFFKTFLNKDPDNFKKLELEKISKQIEEVISFKESL